MKLEELFREIKVFSEVKHGSSDYDKDELFVMGKEKGEFAPLRYLKKKLPDLESYSDLLKTGFIFDSYDLLQPGSFPKWYEFQFSKKLLRKVAKKITVVHQPDNKTIFDAVEGVCKCYETLREQQIIMNGKNLPVQLGEWYVKCIFGLKQVKSTSQRGFDFYLDEKRVEVKVDWGDKSSPKGIKLRKSLVELSDYAIVIYVAKNFRIREICVLDSEFILRKFAGKGHTIFLKDSDVSPYFFSKSSRHDDKVVNSSSLLKFSSPTFAMKIMERYQ